MLSFGPRFEKIPPEPETGENFLDSITFLNFCSESFEVQLELNFFFEVRALLLTPIIALVDKDTGRYNEYRFSTFIIVF